MGHGLVAALRDTAGICDFFKLLLVCAQFFKCSGQAQFPDKISQRVNTGQSQLLIRFPVAGDTPYILGKPDKFRQPLFIHMAVINRMDYRQAAAVVAVGIGPKLMFHVVTLEVALLAHLDEAVFCHGRIPHQIRPGCVILRIFHCNAQVADNALHQRLHDVVGNIVLIGLTEIGLHNVTQDVEAAGGHLLFRYRERIGRVHQGEAGIEGWIIPSSLYLLFLVGNHGSAVALAAGARHCNHNAQRQRLKVDDAGPRPKIIPDVSVIPGGQRHSLAAVHSTAAAHSQDHVCVVLAGQLCSLLHFGIGGVGHNAGELYNGLARFLQNAGDLIIDTIFLDAATAIGEQNGIGVFCQAGQILFYTAFTEINLRGVLKNKVVHNNASFL